MGATDGKAMERRSCRPGRRDTRRVDNHPGRGDAGGNGVGLHTQSASRGGSDPQATSRVHSRIEKLRRTAEMVRAIRPPATRRLAIDLALVTGQPISEIERLTFGDAYYIIGRLEQRANASRPRGRRYRG